MSGDMAPSGKGDGKVKRSIGLTSEVWDQLERFRAASGEDLSETLRHVVKAGLLTEAERESKILEADSLRLSIENQRLINRRLQAKEGGALDAVAFLKNHDDENVRRAADDLEKWLQKG